MEEEQTRRSKPVVKVLTVPRADGVWFWCRCVGCGHEWEMTVQTYVMFKSFGCGECGGVYYEAFNPAFAGEED